MVNESILYRTNFQSIYFHDKFFIQSIFVINLLISRFSRKIYQSINVYKEFVFQKMFINRFSEGFSRKINGFSPKIWQSIFTKNFNKSSFKKDLWLNRFFRKICDSNEVLWKICQLIDFFKSYHSINFQEKFVFQSIFTRTRFRRKNLSVNEFSQKTYQSINFHKKIDF